MIGPAWRGIPMPRYPDSKKPSLTRLPLSVSVEFLLDGEAAPYS